MKKLISCIKVIAASIPLVLFLIFVFPLLWHHGSSYAFKAAITVTIILAFVPLYVFVKEFS